MRTGCFSLSASHRRGVVLLFSVAVLSILVLVACTFAGISKVERNVSRNYVDHVRSMMLATSGVETAVAHLTREVRDPALFLKHRFFGEDLNENGVADAGEDADNDGWQADTCPLSHATHPSYMLDVDGDGTLDARDLIEVEGRKLGVTGILPSTYTFQGDTYAVKVSDLSRKLNVNMDGHPFLQATMENLMEEVGLGKEVGTLIFQNRPYGSLLEMRDRCGLTPAQFEVAKEYLTVYGWFDTRVVNAVPLSQRLKAGLGIGSYVYTWQEMRPRQIDFPRDAKGKVVGRCPVNVNLAPRELLVALMRDLSGFYLDEQRDHSSVNSGYEFMGVHYSYSGPDGALGQVSQTPAITRAQAGRIADAILAHRAGRPFATWQEFNQFLWDEVWRKGILTRQQIDVLKANFNPNSNLCYFNPSSFLFQWVDKTSLLHWTTEFTFAPTGYYEIESIGRVMNVAREVVAEAELLVDVKMFDIYRESTQKDFLYDYWKNGVEIRDNIISRNRGAGKTDGGTSLMTYPEVPNRDWVKDADYDGHIELATKQSSGSGADFQATYFDNGLDADTRQPLVRDADGPYFDRLVDQRGGSGAWRPGKLFPDGVYSELDSVPMYRFTPTNPHDFSACLWIKPHFFPEHAGRSRVFMTWQHPVFNAAVEVPMLPLGIYCTVTSHVEDESVGGYEYQKPWDTPAILAGGTVDRWEGACATPCLNHVEHGHPWIERAGERWGTMFEGGRWMHVGWIHNGAAFEGRARDGHGTHHDDLDVLYVNGRKVSGVFGYQTPDVQTPSTYVGELLRLGERRDAAALNVVPDATLDEVLVWNHVSLPQSEQRILDEWNDGRFYNEDDGTFTSRAIDLAAEAGVGPGAPTQIDTVSWTPYVPDSLPNGKITVELVKAYDRSPLAGAHEYTKPGGEKVDLPATEPIRYRVHFKSGVGGAQPIVDTLVFADITITSSKGPRFLSWAWVMQ